MRTCSPPPSDEVFNYAVRREGRDLRRHAAELAEIRAQLDELIQELSAVQEVERGWEASETTRDARFVIKAAHATAPENGR